MTGQSKLKTEDTGKEWEMAMCLAFDTPYQGPFRYDMDRARSWSPRLIRAGVQDMFPPMEHTAQGGARYDFSGPGGEFLSAKSTKKDGMIAPQLFGQAQPQKFSEELLGIPYIDIPNLKRTIQDPQYLPKILAGLEEATFSCAILYINAYDDKMLFIIQQEPLPWERVLNSICWTRRHESWNNSSSLQFVKAPGAKKTTLLEFQFHTRSRTNMAIRWKFETILKEFSECFHIWEIP